MVGEQAHRDQHVGEVDAGHADRDLDLARSRRNPFAGNQFQRFQIAGRADLQAHPVGLMVGDGGVPFVGAQRTGAACAPCTTRRLARRSRLPRIR